MMYFFSSFLLTDCNKNDSDGRPDFAKLDCGLGLLSEREGER